MEGACQFMRCSVRRDRGQARSTFDLGVYCIGLNPITILPSYLPARSVIQTPVFRLLPSQTIERICALERLAALG